MLKTSVVRNFYSILGVIAILGITGCSDGAGTPNTIDTASSSETDPALVLVNDAFNTVDEPTARIVLTQALDATAPTATIESPGIGDTEIVSSFVFEGTALDTGGSNLKDVRYLLRDLVTRSFVSPNGEVESPRVIRAASLALNDPDNGVWSVPSALPTGQYRLYITVRDQADNANWWVARKDITVTVQNPVADKTAPSIVIQQPAQDATLPVSAQSFQGTSSDVGGSGVAQIFYVTKRLPGGEYVSPNGTLESPRVLRDASVSSAGSDSASWRIDTTFPEGQYRMYISARDGAGNTNWWGVRRDVLVEGGQVTDSVFVPASNDIVDPVGFYSQDGYDSVNLLRIDVATRTTPGNCTEDDDSGCTLADVLADSNGDDDFTVDIPVKVIATDFPDDGLEINAGLRQRGSSSRTAPQKSFRLRFIGDAGLWRSEQRVQLNKHPFDQSRVLNKLSFDLMAQVPHLPSLRTQFVNLWIDDGNGPVDQGLYTHVEAVKKEYLINRDRDRDDNLYKADFFLFSPADLAEMAIDANGEPIDSDRFDRRLEVERGDDHRKLIEMLTALNDPNQSFQSVFDRYFNLNNVLMWMSVNRLLGNQDVISQNYYLYNPRGTETFYFLPWDYDGAMRTEPQLDDGSFEFEALRTRQTYGYARAGDNVFLDKFLRLPNIHNTLVAAGNEVRTNWLNDSAIRTLTNQYTPVVRPIVAREPDISNVAGIREPENMGVWDARIASFPGIVAANLAELERSPSMPLMPFLKTPFQRNNQTVLWWNPAYEVTGGVLTYDMQIASTPDFAPADIIFSTTSIANAPGSDRVELALTRSQLPAGNWYYRIQARTSNPALYQVARNRLTIDGQRYIGVRGFSVGP